MKKLKKLSAILLSLMTAITLFSVNNNSYAKSNRRQVYDALIALGYNKAAAAGIMSNIKHESSYNPRAGRSCFGLIQWTGGRKSSLKRYCARKGLSSSSIKGQVAFLNHELQTSYRGVYRTLKHVSNSSSGAHRAAYKFCYDFERPAARSAASNKRARYARSLYRSL